MNYLGIDIGGSGIKGAIVDTQAGKLLTGRFRIPTPQPSRSEAVADVVAKIVENFQYRGPAGITFPGIIKNGHVGSAANVDESWVGVDAAALFRERLGGPVEIINDADAAGLAEVTFGAAKGIGGVVILLTLGTGIGSAIFLDGKLLPNSEFGHMKIRGKDAELRASERVREEKGLSLKRWAASLGEVLAELEKLFSPDLFVIGGGISKKADKFLPHLREFTQVEVVPARMQNEAGIIGAAWLAAQKS
ncbi:MAG: ROK family protein [Terrimicrobiaceae bacterium]